MVHPVLVDLDRFLLLTRTLALFSSLQQQYTWYTRSMRQRLTLAFRTAPMSSEENNLELAGNCGHTVLHVIHVDKPPS